MHWFTEPSLCNKLTVSVMHSGKPPSFLGCPLEHADASARHQPALLWLEVCCTSASSAADICKQVLQVFTCDESIR